MPELDLAEEATRYLLGELSPEERSRFEAHLAESAELRALVRQLEEGALALSMAAPRHEPPRRTWERIEKAIERETTPRAGLAELWMRFWRNGWAVAAAAVIGWALYALYAHQSPVPSVPVGPVAAGNQPRSHTVAVQPAPRSAPEPGQPASAEKAILPQLLSAKTQEIAVLHWRLAEQTNRLAQLARALDHQQALLTEPGRVKFLQLTPNSVAATNLAPVSKELQRALFLAMARELGWAAPGTTAPDGEAQAAGSTGATNQAPVDFVDLRSATNPLAESSPAPVSAPVSPGSAADSTLQAAAGSSASVPGFVSGTNAVLAFDSSVVPSGTSLSFWTAASGGQYQSLGTTTVGNNPVVVTVPFSANDPNGSSLTIMSASPGGLSNVFQFSTPGVFPP